MTTQSTGRQRPPTISVVRGREPHSPEDVAEQLGAGVAGQLCLAGFGGNGRRRVGQVGGVVDVHAPEDEAPPSSGQRAREHSVRAVHPCSGDRLRSEDRQRGAQRVRELADAIIVRRADAGDAAASSRRLASHLGVAPSTARTLIASGTMRLGDAYALPAGIAMELLDAVRTDVARRQPPLRLSPEKHALRIAGAAAQIAGAIEQGASPDVVHGLVRRLVERAEQADQDITGARAA